MPVSSQTNADCDRRLILPNSINIFVWAVALCAHAACKSFGALFAVRFILGMCEGAITPGFILVTSMFYTRAEQNKRTGYWCMSLLHIAPTTHGPIVADSRILYYN